MVRRALAARAREFCLGIDPPDERLASVVNHLVDIGALMVTCYSRGFLVFSRLESVATSPAALATGLVRRCLSSIGVLRGNVTLLACVDCPMRPPPAPPLRPTLPIKLPPHTSTAPRCPPNISTLLPNCPLFALRVKL